MAVVLLKLLCSTLNSLINLASLLFFKGSAIFIVILIRVLRVPGLAINCVLEQIKYLLEEAVKYALKVIGDGFTSIARSNFDFLGGTASRIFNQTTMTAKELGEKMMTEFESLSKIVPEVAKGLKEMIEQMASDITSNFMDAIKYIIHNV